MRLAHDPHGRRGLGRDLIEQRAREGLVPLDLGPGPGRTDGARALREQRIDYPGRQRLIGADHRHVHLSGAREGGDGARVADISDRIAPAGLLRAAHDRRVGMTDERVQLAALAHALRERALTPPVTDDQSSHARRTIVLSARAAPQGEGSETAPERQRSMRPRRPPSAPRNMPAIASITIRSGGKPPSETFACVPAIACAIKSPRPKRAPPTRPRSAPPQPSRCSKPASTPPTPASAASPQ